VVEINITTLGLDFLLSRTNYYPLFQLRKPSNAASLQDRIDGGAKCQLLAQRHLVTISAHMLFLTTSPRDPVTFVLATPFQSPHMTLKQPFSSSSS
jgi:hypothetical protein